jgi:hypothetical protein
MIFFNNKSEIAKFDVMINQEMIRFPRMFEKLILDGTLSEQLLRGAIIDSGEAKLIDSHENQNEIFFACLYPEVGFFQHYFRLNKKDNEFIFTLNGIYDYDGIRITYVGKPSESIDTRVIKGKIFFIKLQDFGKGIGPNTNELRDMLLKSPNFTMI